MPKRRGDVQVVAYRVDQAILDGRASVIPIYPPLAQRTYLGRRPTVLILTKSIRLRLPPVRLDDPDKFIRRRHRKWDNRLTISPAILDSVYVKIPTTSPQYQWVQQVEPEELVKRQIFRRQGDYRIRIYHVVEDIDHALRKGVHISESYESEIRTLEKSRYAIHDRLAQARAGLLHMSDWYARSLNLTLANIGLRREDIGAILDDRAGRDRRLYEFAHVSQMQLLFLTESFISFVGSISRLPKINHQPIATYLTGLDLELQFFTSREIDRLIKKARSRINRVIFTPLNRSEILTELGTAASELTEASDTLCNWIKATVKNPGGPVVTTSITAGTN